MVTLSRSLTVRLLSRSLSVGVWLASLTAVAAAPPPGLRLDGSVRPLRYAARLEVRPEEPRFAGRIDLELTLARPTEVVWLHADHLTVARAHFLVGKQTIAATPVEGGAQLLGFRAAAPLPAGPARLHVEYSGVAERKDSHGLFEQQENGDWYAFSQLESVHARQVFPCFDEPGFKVPWQLTIEAPEKLVVLSNAAPVGEKREHPGMKTVTFAETRPLPSYLVAFAVGPFDLVDAGRAGQKHLPVRLAVPRGRGADTRYAREATATIVERLEAWFGTPFPYDKLDLVSIPLPTGFSAMENPGLVTFAQGLLVATQDNDTQAAHRRYASVAAHELAHQWFGDWVTTAWWDDIWLNESFASWMETKIVDAWHPEWSHGTGPSDARSGALGADSLASARRIRQPITGSDDIFNAFDGITYAKGESVLAMFERYVGPEVFQRGVRRYLAAHADGNATADDFVGAISQAAGRELKPAFGSFLDQAGAPLVRLGVRCGKEPALTLSQSRYLPLGAPAPAPQTWQIPMCVSWAKPKGAPGEPSQRDQVCTLLSAPSATVPLPAGSCPAWVEGNTAGLGYYRLAYERPLLQHLIEHRDALSLNELLALVDDVEALAANGQLPLGEALGLVQPLAADPRREVAEAAVELASQLTEELVPERLRPGRARFVQKELGPRAHQLGWLPRPGEDEDTRRLRRALVPTVARLGEDAPLRQQAVTLARAWLADRHAVDGDLVDGVLSAAALAGGAGLFDAVYAAARREKERADRRRMVGLLGQFNEPELARRALGIALGDDFDARESAAILGALGGRVETRELTWTFVKDHVDELTRRLSPQVLARLFWVPHFCDEAHRVEVEAFLRDRAPKLPGGTRNLAQRLERIDQCRAFVRAQQPSALQFLERYR